MSKALSRCLPPPRPCERYLQRCAHQRIHFAQRDDIRPLLSTSPIPASRLQHRSRPFSTCSRRQAVMRASMPKVKQKPQQSIAVSQQKQRAQVMGKGQIPDDMGLFEGTFIMPFGKNRPSWVRNFKERWSLEKHRLWVRVGELVQLISYRFVSIRPRPRLHKSTAVAVGKNMHREMYEAFAAGNLQPVQGEICTGLLSSLRSRIGQRPANTYLRWTLHRYLTSPRLVSYKCGVLPNVDGTRNKDREAQNGFVQAVVRIHSLQSLQHVRTTTVRDRGKLVTKEVLVDSQGRELPADGTPEAAAKRNAKETVEYFVIQKQLKRSKEGPWMVWGTAEESSLEKVERGLKKRKEEKAKAKGRAEAAAATA